MRCMACNMYECWRGGGWSGKRRRKRSGIGGCLRSGFYDAVHCSLSELRSYVCIHGCNYGVGNEKVWKKM